MLINYISVNLVQKHYNVTFHSYFSYKFKCLHIFVTRLVGYQVMAKSCETSGVPNKMTLRNNNATSGNIYKVSPIICQNHKTLKVEHLKRATYYIVIIK